MTIEFPKAKFHFLRNGNIVTVTEINSNKSIDFLNQPESNSIDTDFLLLGFVTTFPDVEIS
jgi:hypothetical protein